MSETTQQPLTVKDIPIVENKELRKVITASGLGNAVEWFDFSVYGFLAVIIGRTFFAAAPPSIQLIASLATFSVPFLFRPLGGAIFGYLGDKYGRKNILSFTIILMSASTFCIGIIPSYQTIGIIAPILLILAKVIQGLSVGGEYAGAVVFVGEYSPDRKRGFMASWLDFGSTAGFLVGALVVSVIYSIIGDAGMNEWGWRIPFLLSLPLGLIGLYLRKSLDESPAFEAQEAGEDNTTSIGEIFRNNLGGIAISCCLVISTNTIYYMLLTYLPNYLSVNLGYSDEHGVRIVIIVMVFMLCLQPIIGFVSDKIGRKPFLYFGSVALLFSAYPCFWMIQHEDVIYISLGIGILAVILSCFIGIMASILPALFPTDVRFRTLAICFNIAVFIAGITPPVAAWLVESTGSLYMPAYYLMVVAVFGFITAVSVPETANRPLMDAPPIASSKSEAKEVLKEHFDNIEDQVSVLEEKISDLEEQRQNLVDQHPKLN
ncbi:glycine betaine/L-proline transporter ProP [Bartonella tamiae]|uniref:MFS transporter, metabolite:H+ symporter (MHS) family protein n=1 Tax=Bartonella tamiae Th239 TaxID=1094558 RepID=J0ZLY2_9HYPH|nr:glycine betaine/L-proline transporter ProP [Bartonella tamiae]EJF89413.1 MFS transporter, metabolite:H+ symporter (MHS) family protein [Bartonella tamiae Th239]EJF92722.1 MFS transporter, metabolite:H+ symporter (MHS) family protein [Bartonella tamiae Th307]